MSQDIIDILRVADPGIGDADPTGCSAATFMSCAGKVPRKHFGRAKTNKAA